MNAYDQWMQDISECQACKDLYDLCGQVPEAAICDSHYGQLKQIVDEEELKWWDNQIAGGKRIQAEIDAEKAEEKPA